MKQIFIAGPSRTGSKFYMQLLNSHKNIFISPELIFRHPIKKDLYKVVDQKIKDKASIEEIYSAVLTFKERLPYIKVIESIGPALLRSELCKLEKVTAYSIFDTIMKTAALVRGKKLYGAKFALHFSYTNELIEKFPESKVLYLTRDPRAIFISDFKKKKKESSGNYYRFPIKGKLLRFVMIFYIIREWKWSMRTYERCKHKHLSDRIKLFSYEKLIDNQSKVVQQIAIFLDMSSNEFNADVVEVVDSSYQFGLSKDRWRSEILRIELFLFKLFLGRKMKKYGYY